MLHALSQKNLVSTGLLLTLSARSWDRQSSKEVRFQVKFLLIPMQQTTMLVDCRQERKRELSTPENNRSTWTVRSQNFSVGLPGRQTLLCSGWFFLGAEVVSGFTWPRTHCLRQQDTSNRWAPSKAMSLNGPQTQEPGASGPIVNG